MKACNEDDERGGERHAFLVVGEAVRAFSNGDRGTMDTEGRRDEPDRLHSEWPGVHGDSANDLVDRGEPGSVGCLAEYSVALSLVRRKS
jgi:hypothetical protein